MSQQDGRPAVRYERRGPVGWIRLQRPEAMNAIDGACLTELEAAVEAAAADDEARSIAIAGTGRSFCAGADLAFVEGLLTGGDGELSLFLNDVMRVFTRVEVLPKPTIAALNGTTVAGGLELALCCDFIVAAAGARIGDGHANFAILPGGGSSVRLPRRIGLSSAKLLLFSGRLLDAEEARVAGLVDRVVEGEQLEAAVETLAAPFADKSPLVLRRLKALVSSAADRRVEDGLRAEIEAFEAHAGAYDLREGLAAFREKRKPAFLGY